MKYNANNKPLICMLTNNPCYKGTTKMQVKGVLWHSTGSNNPDLKRYVQPSDNASDKNEMLNLLGINKYKNDWNHTTRNVGVNAFIGKLADNTVTTVQTMPWDFKPWGCYKGKNGSCNNGWVQFEICEATLTDKTYFNTVYKEACELTAYICNMYNLDPHGTVVMNGVKVPVILCHADSYKLGLGGNHSDVLHWFKKHGKTMDDVRNDVSALMNATNVTPVQPSPAQPSVTPNTSVEFKIGDKVKLVKGATYTSGKSAPSWLFEKTLYVRAIRSDGIVISTLQTGAVTGVVKKEDLISLETDSNKTEAPFIEYKVKINSNALNIRKGAGKNYESIGHIKDRGIYTIVAESDGQGATKWGKLKEYDGWISLDYAIRQTGKVNYQVRINSDALNIRKGAGKNYESIGYIKDRGVYTVIDEADGIGATKWLLLESGIGWISSDFTIKL